jgi:hypothetical protein
VKRKSSNRSNDTIIGKISALHSALFLALFLLLWLF